MVLVSPQIFTFLLTSVSDGGDEEHLGLGRRPRTTGFHFRLKIQMLHSFIDLLLFSFVLTSKDVKRSIR